MDLNLQHRRVVLAQTDVELLCKPLSTVAWQRVAAALARTGGGPVMVGDPEWGRAVAEILTEHVVKVTGLRITPESGPSFDGGVKELLEVGMLFRLAVGALIQLYGESALTEAEVGKSSVPLPTS